MKKLYSLFALAALLLSYSCTHDIHLDKKPIDNNTEDTTDKENNSDDSSSSEDNKNDDIIVIPNNEIWYTSIDGKIVEPYDSIGFGANIISNTYENGKGVITFDGEVTEIRHFAFYDCDGLTSITIPDSVAQIVINPFQDCNNLAEFKGKFASEDGRCLIVDGVLNSFAPAGITTYNIPNSVTEIGYNAFSYCRGLISITILDGVTKIENYAFYNCFGLISITIPNSVTKIGVSPFAGCYNITEFKGKFASEDGRCLIVDGVLNSFAQAGITTYNIPNSVTEIGDSAFYYCKGLTSITIPDSVTSIGNSVFCDCSSLTSVIIPDSVTSIGNSVFYDCSSLTSVIIPDNVTSMGSSIFYNCRSLTNVTISNSVTSIGNSVFNGCSNLKSVIIPDGVTSIGNSVFSGCHSLVSLTIPNSVTEIGDYAFVGCYGLISVYCERTTPPTAGIQFFNANALTRKIYVPRASVAAYKAAEGWKKYADAIEPYDF